MGKHTRIGGIVKFRTQLQGFTLIEVLITVAIIGILAAVALPNYSRYVRRGNTQEATSALANARVKFEQYFQDSRSYVGFVGAGCILANGTSLMAGATKYFTYACTSTDGPPQAFTITATGIAAKSMNGYTYTIDQSDAKTSTAEGTTGATCWITKQGDTC